MIEKENLDKVFDYLEEIENKEKETETNLDSEKTFMKIKKAANIKYHSDLSSILKTLIEKHQIEKSKEPLPNDKRSYPYRIIDKSLREQRKLMKIFFDNKWFNLENDQTITPFLKDIIKIAFTKEKIEKEFTWVELTNEKIELIQKYAFDILNFQIFKNQGLNITLSSENKDIFNHIKKDGKYIKKESYYLLVIGPLIAYMLQLRPWILSTAPFEPFQITINFMPEKNLFIEYKKLENGIFENESLEKKLITTDNGLISKLNSYELNRNRVKQLKEDIKSILEQKQLYTFERILTEYIMNFWLEINE